ncbi:MAG: hypothetical protein R2878_11590 [Thermoleophilia bacterium]
MGTPVVIGQVASNLAPGIDVDVDASGNATAVWTGLIGTVSGSDGPVDAVFFDAARGRWGSSMRLSAPGVIALRPTARILNDGTAVAVWDQYSAGTAPHFTVATTRRAPNSGAWGAPEVLCTPPHDEGLHHSAPVSDPSKRRLGVLCTAVSDEPASQWTRFLDADHWTPQIPLREGRWFGLALRPGGAATAVGTTVPAAGSTTVRRSDIPPGAAAWSAVEAMDAPGGKVVDGAVGTAASGTSVVVWRHGRRLTDGTGVYAAVSAAVQTAGGTWSSPKQLSPLNRWVRRLGLAVPALGPAAVMWTQDAAGGQERAYAKLHTATGWQHAEPVGQGDGPIAFDVGAAEAGAVAAFRSTFTSGIFVSSRGPGAVSSPALSVRQLRINQRISQAALRRIAAVESLLSEPLPAARIRVGALSAPDFAPEAGVSGDGDGSVRAPVRTPIVVPPPAGYGSPGTVTLSARQLRINQRISQAAVRRVAALETRLRAGLTGGDLAPGAVTAAAFAGGVTVSGSVDSPTPAPTTTVVAPAPPRSGGTVRLSAQQLRINQRISGGVVRRVNALITQLEYGVRGDQIRDGSLTRSALSAALR